jgi:hypothetical protein
MKRLFFLLPIATCNFFAYALQEFQSAVGQALETGNDRKIYSALSKLDLKDTTVQQKVQRSLHMVSFSPFHKASQGCYFFNKKHLPLFTPEVLDLVKSNLKNNGKSEKIATTIITMIAARRRKQEIENALDSSKLDHTKKSELENEHVILERQLTALKQEMQEEKISDTLGSGSPQV